MLFRSNARGEGVDLGARSPAVRRHRGQPSDPERHHHADQHRRQPVDPQRQHVGLMAGVEQRHHRRGVAGEHRAVGDEAALQIADAGAGADPQRQPEDQQPVVANSQMKNYKPSDKEWSVPERHAQFCATPPNRADGLQGAANLAPWPNGHSHP